MGVAEKSDLIIQKPFAAWNMFYLKDQQPHLMPMHKIPPLPYHPGKKYKLFPLLFQNSAHDCDDQADLHSHKILPSLQCNRILFWFYFLLNGLFELPVILFVIPVQKEVPKGDENYSLLLPNMPSHNPQPGQ